MEFPAKLDRLMKMRGETQRSLASHLRLSHRAIGGWLGGARPRQAVMLRLAEHYDVPVQDLSDDSRDLPFDRYSATLRAVTEKAQAAYPNNPEAAMHAADMLHEERHRKVRAARLRKVIAELASIAYEMDTSDETLHRISHELKELK